MKGESQTSQAPEWIVESRYCRGNYGLNIRGKWEFGMPEDKKYSLAHSDKVLVTELIITGSGTPTKASIIAGTVYNGVSNEYVLFSFKNLPPCLASAF